VFTSELLDRVHPREINPIQTINTLDVVRVSMAIPELWEVEFKARLEIVRSSAHNKGVLYIVHDSLIKHANLHTAVQNRTGVVMWAAESKGLKS
jgi:hypothetical protein